VTWLMPSPAASGPWRARVASRSDGPPCNIAALPSRRQQQRRCGPLQRIVEAGGGDLDSLGPHGITKAKLDELMFKLKVYDTCGCCRARRGRRRSGDDRIGGLLTESDELLGIGSTR